MFIKNIAFVFALFVAEVCAGSVRERFQAWVDRFAMDFESTMHYESTLSKWVENDKFIEEMNGKNLTYTLGHNHFPVWIPLTLANILECRELSPTTMLVA